MAQLLKQLKQEDEKFEATLVLVNAPRGGPRWKDPGGRTQVGAPGGQRITYPTAVRKPANRAALQGGQLQAGHLHLHTHAHGDTLPPGGGAAGAARTQEVRKPREQKSHNLGPFKPSRPSRPIGWQPPPLPGRPPQAPTPLAALGLTSRLRRRRASCTRLPQSRRPPRALPEPRSAFVQRLTDLPSVWGTRTRLPYRGPGGLAAGDPLLSQHGGRGTPRRAWRAFPRPPWPARPCSLVSQGGHKISSFALAMCSYHYVLQPHQRLKSTGPTNQELGPRKLFLHKSTLRQELECKKFIWEEKKAPVMEVRN
ncbi:uncharacterized protein LOC120887454 [Ictidomys tridecemlineatus]